MLANTTLNGNSAVLGGAVAVCGNGSFIESDQVALFNNSASMGGGVIALSAAQLFVSAGTLQNNTAMYGGAVALVGDSQCSIADQSVIVGNAAVYQGGAVYVSVTHGEVQMDASSRFRRNKYCA